MKETNPMPSDTELARSTKPQEGLASPRTRRFAVVVALTTEYIEMALGILAALRFYHPEVDLIIYTDATSRSNVKSVADRFCATDLRIQPPTPFEFGDWNSIVSVKFDIFGLRYAHPILYLDVDQILYRSLAPYVDAFERSGALVAGSLDDEALGQQFKAGAIPLDIDINAPAINTGAFFIRSDPAIHRRIRGSLDYFSARARLPTQSVINGLIQMDGLPLHVFGEDFMAGPFSRRVLDNPRTSALIHFWTPRPPFMKPSPVRHGELTYDEMKDRFLVSFGVSYPEDELERDYRYYLERAKHARAGP